MKREETGQVKVGVGIEVLWRALGKDLNSILPTIVPRLVKEAEILQGDGGFGTVYLFKFGPGERLTFEINFDSTFFLCT